MAAAHRTAAYQRDRAALKARRLQPCVLCEGDIDYEASAPDPLSFSAEHPPGYEVRVHGTHLPGTPLMPAHLGCQNRQGARAGRAAQLARIEQPRTSGVL